MEQFGIDEWFLQLVLKASNLSAYPGLTGRVYQLVARCITSARPPRNDAYSFFVFGLVSAADDPTS